VGVTVGIDVAGLEVGSGNVGFEVGKGVGRLVGLGAGGFGS